MSDAGVSPEVIKTYIENKPQGFSVTADDLVALKRRGISDQISTALVKRGSGPLPAGPREGANPTPAPPQVVVAAPAAGMGYGGIDPESYDYFRMYYLHPRALAAAYQRLGWYGPPYGYGFGYSRNWGYGPTYAPGFQPWGYGYGPYRGGFYPGR
jgi:hypothetical protein